MLTTFQILGPVTLVDPHGGDLTPRSSHQRTLLADLIIHANQVLSVDRLVDDLWGERPPVTARSSLHNLVSHLRKALGAETVITRAPGYAILIQPSSSTRCASSGSCRRRARRSRAGACARSRTR